MGRAMRAALLGGIFLVALAAVPYLAHAQESVAVEGLLRSGTAGEELPPNLTVALNVFNRGDRLETRESIADAEGRFSFEGVPGGEGIGYIISAEYSGATYSYESDYPLPPGPVELIVYESIDSSEAIQVRSHSLVVSAADPDAQVMEVLELVGLENTGDRTFVPDLAQAGQMNMLRFSLPSPVSDLDVQTTMRGGRILQVDLGFALTTPVQPGEYEVAYRFRSYYEDGRLTFDHGFPFGADTFHILLPEGLGQVSGNGLQETEPLVLAEGVYRRLESKDLSAGSRIEIEFVGLPQPPLWRRWQNTLTGEDFLAGAIPGAFGIALLALLAYVFLRARRSSGPVMEGSSERPYFIEAIALLDDRFQRREIGRTEYLQERSDLKGRLLGSGDSPPWQEAQPTPEGGGSSTSTDDRGIERPEH